MALRRSKFLIISMLFIESLYSQYMDFDTSHQQVYSQEQYSNGDINNSSFVAFSDSTIEIFNNQSLNPSMDETSWKRVFSKVDFKESDNKKDSLNKKEKKTKKERRTNSVSFSAGNLSWLWYTLAIAVILSVIFFLLPWMKTRNVKNELNEEILFGDENPDESALIQSNIRKSFQIAYDKGDYRVAFRLLYLDTLKRFVEKNWIVYRKEKTNFDYLMQLSNKPVYSAFGQLTLAFDEIWYGDIVPDAQQMSTFLKLFDDIEKEVKRA